MNAKRIGLEAAVLAVLGCAASATHAANATFQNYFFLVCQSPTGALATRCAETISASGNLSGDSESSLNPSQALSNNTSALSMTRSRATEVQEFSAAARGDDAIEMGKTSLLAIGRGAWEERDRIVDVDAERGYESDSQGFEIGLERRATERVAIGGWLSYDASSGEFDRERPGANFNPVGTAGDVEQRSWGVTLYLTTQLGDAGFFDVAGGYVQSELDLPRRAVFQESRRAVAQTNVDTDASTDGRQYWASANLGYEWVAGAWSFGINAHALWAQAALDPYTESDRTGSGLAMRFDVADRDSVLGSAGVHAQRAIRASFGVVVPYIRADYVHEFGFDPQRVVTQYLLDAQRTAFVMDGDEPDREYAAASIGLTFVLPNGWMPYLSADTLVGNDDMDRYRLTLGVRREL